MISLDLSKAFDSVSDDLLLGKLSHYGFNGPMHKLLQSYIDKRVQVVYWDDKLTSQEEIKYDVPHGSILIYLPIYQRHGYRRQFKYLFIL